MQVHEEPGTRNHRFLSRKESPLEGEMSQPLSNSDSATPTPALSCRGSGWNWKQSRDFSRGHVSFLLVQGKEGPELDKEELTVLGSNEFQQVGGLKQRVATAYRVVVKVVQSQWRRLGTLV